jgi:hypothetical protein
VKSAVTTMTEPSAAPVSADRAPLAYWVGLTLRDGTFIQVGYATNFDGCTGNSWFFYVIKGSTTVYNDDGDCGMTGSRTFSLNQRTTTTSSNGTVEYGWNGAVSGLGVVGHTYYTTSDPDSGTHSPGVISELVENGSGNLGDQIPGVKYDAAIQYSKAGTGPYTNVAHGTVNRSTDAACSRSATVKYQVFNDAVADELRAGTVYSSPCYDNGHSLW